MSTKLPFRDGLRLGIEFHRYVPSNCGHPGQMEPGIDIQLLLNFEGILPELLLSIQGTLLQVREALVKEGTDPWPTDPDEEYQDRDCNCPNDQDSLEANCPTFVPVNPSE